MSDNTDYHKRYHIQRVAVAIDYYITALNFIPEYEANDAARAMHLKHLEEALAEMKELLK